MVHMHSADVQFEIYTQFKKICESVKLSILIFKLSMKPISRLVSSHLTYSNLFLFPRWSAAVVTKG